MAPAADLMKACTLSFIVPRGKGRACGGTALLPRVGISPVGVRGADHLFALSPCSILVPDSSSRRAGAIGKDAALERGELNPNTNLQYGVTVCHGNDIFLSVRSPPLLPQPPGCCGGGPRNACGFSGADKGQPPPRRRRMGSGTRSIRCRLATPACWACRSTAGWGCRPPKPWKSPISCVFNRATCTL